MNVHHDSFLFIWSRYDREIEVQGSLTIPKALKGKAKHRSGKDIRPQCRNLAKCLTLSYNPIRFFLSLIIFAKLQKYTTGNSHTSDQVSDKRARLAVFFYIQIHIYQIVRIERRLQLDNMDAGNQNQNISRFSHRIVPHVCQKTYTCCSRLN